MIIDEISLRHVQLELVEPFETSFGREIMEHSVIVRIRSGERAAWGEAPVDEKPYYCSEFADGALRVMRDHLAPLVMGKPIETPADLHALMRPVRGNQMAKGGIDTAVHVMLAEEEGKSLAAYLGGVRKKVASGVSIGIQRDDAGNASIDRLLDAVSRRIDEGYRRIKIKIKPGYDLDAVKAVRDAFGDDLPLQVDANSAYTLDDIELFRKMDRYGLLLIEQPLGYDDIIDHATLQAAVETPICLDESIKSPDDVRHAIALKSCRVINIKHTRVGGLYNAVIIHDMCQREGIPVWCGGMLESAIGQAHAIAMASMANFVLPGDVAPSDRYFARDLIREFVEMEEGYLPVPTRPGLGFDVDEEYLEEITLEKATVSVK